MGASSFTPTIELPQFGDNDKPNWLGDINGAFADIDAAHLELLNRVIGNETTLDADVATILGTVGSSLRNAYRTIHDGEMVNAALHGVAGAGDRTAAMQALFDTLVDGDTIIIPKGTWRIDGTITCDNSIRVILAAGAVWDRSQGNALTDGIVLTGANVRVEGHGKILSPATFDGTNSTPTYGVLRLTGASPKVYDITLENVPRVGIFFNNCDDMSTCVGVKILGNYDSALWDEIKTVHYGIGYDPGTTNPHLIATGNRISGCVQGVFAGNYGAGASNGSVISGNRFETCYNHGVYGSTGCDEISIANNTFRNCSRPIVVTGRGHRVIGNVCTTSLTGTNNAVALGINVRNGIDCVVGYNVLIGEFQANSLVAIDLSNTGGGTEISRCAVIGNVIMNTGAVGGTHIRVGAGAATTLRDVVVQGNVCGGPGKASTGCISVNGAAGSQARGIKIIDNIIRIVALCYAIAINECDSAEVRGNTMQLDYSAGAAEVVGGVALSANSKDTYITANTFKVLAGVGTNVSWRLIYEVAATVSKNRYENNRYAIDPATTATIIQILLQAGTAPMIRESGSGAPATSAQRSSTWLRTDGGASTTFYVKETDETSAVWRAV